MEALSKLVLVLAVLQQNSQNSILAPLYSEWPKLHWVYAVQSAIELQGRLIFFLEVQNSFLQELIHNEEVAKGNE